MSGKGATGGTRDVLVPVARWERWWTNFEERHGAATLELHGGALTGTGADGAAVLARLPFGRVYDGPAELASFAECAERPETWGLLLVRKGGFAVAALHGVEVLVSKVGQRHVQGRTKAGGQSQQRFARRRDNQARVAYEAAADHAHRVLVGETPEPVAHLVCGGDRPAVAAVLEDPRLARLAERRCDPWLDVPDPRRAVLDRATEDGRAVRVSVRDP